MLVAIFPEEGDIKVYYTVEDITLSKGKLKVGLHYNESSDKFRNNINKVIFLSLKKFDFKGKRDLDIEVNLQVYKNKGNKNIIK